MKKSLLRIMLVSAIVAAMAICSSLTAFAATSVNDIDDFGAAGEYVLSGDIEGDLELTEGTYKIDLDGCEWKGNLTIKGADVTIIDSDESKMGLMTVDNNDVIIIESGSLTVTEITIEGNYSGCDGIFAKGGTIVINDCDISAVSSAIQNKGGTMTVNGGYFTSNSNGMKVNNNSFITVNGANVLGALCVGDNNASYGTVEAAFVPGEGFVMNQISGGYEFVEDNSSDNDSDNDNDEDIDEDVENTPTGDVVSLAFLAFSAISACAVATKKKEH